LEKQARGFLCSGPEHSKCQIQEELEGGKGWRKDRGRRRKEVDFSVEVQQFPASG